MSLSTKSRRVSTKPLAPTTVTTASGTIEPSGARAVRVSKVWAQQSESHGRRRLTAPLLDFVSALRGAISAFGQGHVGTRSAFTQRQVAEIEELLGCSLQRSPGEATRILYLGDLSPHSGVVDLLYCVIAWAERNRDRPVDICWAGSGDLQGVLRAQSKPPNLTQSFTQFSNAAALAALAADRGILAVPKSGITDLLPIAQAMAAGLPVLGSSRCPEVCMLVTSPATGWLFDPLSPVDMAGALDAALSTSPVRLAEMSAAVRRRLSSLCDEWGGAENATSLRLNSTEFATSGQA